MKAILKTGIFLIMVFLKCLTAGAQLTISKYEMGIAAGVFVYQGDLTPMRLGSYNTLKPVVNLYVNKIVTPMFSLRTNLAIGALKGDDAKYSSPAYRQQRNFKFKSPVFEVSELFVADLLRNNLSKRSFGFSPYVFTGLGVSILRTRRDYSRFNGEYFASEASTLRGLSADAQHALPGIIPVVPVGVGIKYALTQRISLSAETSYRLTFTDYLDGFSKAANDKKRDSYQSHTIGIIYRFVTNNSMKCPVF